MDLRLTKLQLFYNYSAKALLLRIFLFGAGMALIPCLLFVREIEASEGCEPWNMPLPLPFPIPILKIFKTQENATVKTPVLVNTVLKASVFTAVFQDLIDKNSLRNSDSALCVGRNSAQAVMALRKLGMKSAIGVDSRPCSSLVRRGDVYDLPFGDGSFDFVFSRALDGVRVPARLVLEMERVLKPGKVGVVLRRIARPLPANLIKTATPVSSFLKFSDVIHVQSVNCSSAIVIFKKRHGQAAVHQAAVPELLGIE